MHVENMKIVNYKKKKNNLYEITFADNSKLDIYDDVILKYGLSLKKEITKDELFKLVQDNKKLESYYVALKYLNTKLRTEKEIKNKLKDYSKECVMYTINRLKEEGYLNNKVYIEAYINDAISLKLVGPQKILFELKKLDFKDWEIDNYLKTIDKSERINKIEKYIDKKILSNHNLSANNLKRKIYMDLINRGFLGNDINEVFNKKRFNDNKAIFAKEYLKLKNKLSKKYSGDTLEYQIKMKLYQKGFREEDFNN